MKKYAPCPCMVHLKPSSKFKTAAELQQSQLDWSKLTNTPLISVPPLHTLHLVFIGCQLNEKRMAVQAGREVQVTLYSQQSRTLDELAGEWNTMHNCVTPPPKKNPYQDNKKRARASRLQSPPAPSWGCGRFMINCQAARWTSMETSMKTSMKAAGEGGITTPTDNINSRRRGQVCASATVATVKTIPSTSSSHCLISFTGECDAQRRSWNPGSVSQ